VADEAKATTRPSPEIAGVTAAAFAFSPAAVVEIRRSSPVARSRR
jgi:hypothetical protein